MSKKTAVVPKEEHAVATTDPYFDMLKEAGFTDTEIAKAEEEQASSAVLMLQVSRDELKEKHAFYIKSPTYFGEDEGDDTMIEDYGQEVHGIIVMAQPIRAVFPEGANQPACAAVGTKMNKGKIDGIVQDNSSEPAVPPGGSCLNCKLNDYKTDCRPKMKLYFLIAKGPEQFIPVITHLTPGSLKHWHGKEGFIRKMVDPNSGRRIPYWAAYTSLSLVKGSNAAYKYAEVVPQRIRNLNIDEAKIIKQFREEAASVMQVSAADYADDGDRVSDDAEASEKGYPSRWDDSEGAVENGSTEDGKLPF